MFENACAVCFFVSASTGMQMYPTYRSQVHSGVNVSCFTSLPLHLRQASFLDASSLRSSLLATSQPSMFCTCMILCDSFEVQVQVEGFMLLKPDLESPIQHGQNVTVRRDKVLSGHMQVCWTVNLQAPVAVSGVATGRRCFRFKTGSHAARSSVQLSLRRRRSNRSRMRHLFE